MPRRRSIKSIAVEAAVFVSLLALFGHLSVNFWERYVLQSELSQMKCSLHSLKLTLANIGAAYDKLCDELKDISKIADLFHVPMNSMNSPQENNKICRNKYTISLNRRRLHDIQVNAVINTKNGSHNYPPKANRGTERDLAKFETKNAAVMPRQDINNKNMMTMTRYPLKSTGAGVSYKEYNQEKCVHRNAVNSKSRCYNDLKPLNYDNHCY